MRKIFSYLTTFSFFLILTPLHADNNVVVSIQETQQPKISETKNNLIKEICDLSFKNFFSGSENEDTKLYFLQPIESEFKALGFSKMLFEQTAKKITEDNPVYREQIKDFAFMLALNVFDKHFSEEELKELLEVYKNPLFQKHTKFLGSGWFAPLIDVLKDPTLFEKYESKINQFIDMLKSPNLELKGKELVELGIKEFQTFVTFIKDHSEILKEKFKVQFPAIATYAIPFFESQNIHKTQEPIIADEVKKD
jgi:hypothetical protein